MITRAGLRKTEFPKTTTFPESSNSFAISAPWSGFSHVSTQICKNSEYWIVSAVRFFNFLFTNSIFTIFVLFTSSKDIPPPHTASLVSGTAASAKLALLLIFLGASGRSCPMERVGNSGSFAGEERYGICRKRKNGQRKPLWSKLSCGTIGDLTALEKMARSNDMFVLKLLSKRLENSFWNAMYEFLLHSVLQ